MHLSTHLLFISAALRYDIITPSCEYHGRDPLRVVVTLVLPGTRCVYTSITGGDVVEDTFTPVRLKNLDIHVLGSERGFEPLREEGVVLFGGDVDRQV